MKLKTGALLILAATLAGCSPYPLPGRLAYDRCGPDGHLESYPRAHDEKHAYGCKRDTDGYLEDAGQGDKRRN